MKKAKNTKEPEKVINKKDKGMVTDMSDKIRNIKKINISPKMKKLIIFTLVAGILLTASLGCVYLFNYRYDIVYGIKDTLVGARGITLERVIAPSLEKINIDDIIDNERIEINNYLWLVNEAYLLDDSAELFLVDIDENGNKISEKAAEMFYLLTDKALELFGEKIIVTSSYRSAAEQAAIFEETPSVAAKVGSSEHQCGLAVDVCIDLYRGRRFIMSETGKWVNENCEQYGFIIRYPYWGKAETDITYEPWHLRYVGFPHAEIIEYSKITLEEYAELFTVGEYYTYKEYMISHQIPDSEGFIYIPQDGEVAISPDNIGGYYVTVKIAK